MLKLKSEIISSVHKATQASDLYEYLQGAIELEHSTIPAYLQALYSIKRGTNPAVANILRSIVVDEMLHMAIAGNVLNAIGGEPVINKPAFIPLYPGPLPMSINGTLQVGLAPLSATVIENVFMEIEEPENPQHFPVQMAAMETVGFATIGLFYAAIVEKLRQLGNKAFIGDRSRQVEAPDWFSKDKLFAVHGVDSAIRALDIIVRQGEGTPNDPFAARDQPAHYYRFAEILYKKRLVPDPKASKGYSYSGSPIDLDPDGIWDMIVDPHVSGYPAGSTALAYAQRFNGIYTNLLNGLHLTFNGAPDHLGTAIGSMYELRLAADALIELRDGSSGKQVAPTFEYAP